MIKWLVAITGSSIQVASLDTSGVHQLESAFAFQLVDSPPVELWVKALVKLKELRELNYYVEHDFLLGKVRIHKFSGHTCSIIVNECRVVYSGSIDRLNGLSKAIEKEIGKLDKE